jgi:hypothetical protein
LCAWRVILQLPRPRCTDTCPGEGVRQSLHRPDFCSLAGRDARGGPLPCWPAASKCATWRPPKLLPPGRAAPSPGSRHLSRGNPNRCGADQDHLRPAQSPARCHAAAALNGTFRPTPCLTPTACCRHQFVTARRRAHCDDSGLLLCTPGAAAARSPANHLQSPNRRLRQRLSVRHVSSRSIRRSKNRQSAAALKVG